jgi:hypothetical protein
MHNAVDERLTRGHYKLAIEVQQMPGVAELSPHGCILAQFVLPNLVRALSILVLCPYNSTVWQQNNSEVCSSELVGGKASTLASAGQMTSRM